MSKINAADPAVISKKRCRKPDGAKPGAVFGAGRQIRFPKLAAVGSFVFGVPIRGSFGLLYIAGMLCVLSGIGIDTIIATFTRSQQQAELVSFFVNPPLSDAVKRHDADRSDAGLDAAID